MKTFKPLHLTLIIAFLFINILQAQIKLRWESVEFLNSTTISAKVFVQNYGSTVNIQNRYGYNQYFRNGYDGNFYIEYDLIFDFNQSNKHIKLLPDSITIETILGGSISMNMPGYRFYSTGSSSGEYWEIIFSIPYESGNVSLTILGHKKFIGDLPKAKANREKRKLNFFSEKDTKVFNYKEFHLDDYNVIQGKLKNAILFYNEKNDTGIVSGIVKYNRQKNGVTIFESNLDDNKLNEYLKSTIGDHNLRKTENFGYTISTKAEFEIFIAKGKSKLKSNNNGDITKINPPIQNEKIMNLISKKIDHKGHYKIKYNYVTINEGKISGSNIEVKKIPILTYLYWGIPILIGITLALL